MDRIKNRSQTIISNFSGPLRNVLLRLRGDLVRAVFLQVVRDRPQHGEAAAAGGLPLLHALRHLRAHHHLLINVLPQDSCHRTLYWQMLTFI